MDKTNKLGEIIRLFLKLGFIAFGGPAAHIALLQQEVVQKRKWVEQSHFLDLVGATNLIPLNGWQGAILATIGIFLPSFIFVALLNPLVPKLRKSGWISAFLDAVNIASVAIIFAVGVEMSVETLISLRMIIIAIISTLIILRYPKLNTAYIIAGGALLGYILHILNM